MLRRIDLAALVLGFTHILMMPALAQQAKEKNTSLSFIGAYRIRIIPSLIVVCPGESVKFTVRTERWDYAYDRWALREAAEGNPLNLVLVHTDDTGTKTKSSGTNVAKTNSEGEFIWAADATSRPSTDELTFFWKPNPPSLGDIGSTSATLTIVTLSKEECDKRKAETPQDGGTVIKKIDDFDKYFKMKETGPVLKAIDDLGGDLKDLKPTKRSVPKRAPAIKELETLKRRTQLLPLAWSDLEKTLAVRDALMLDNFERKGRLARITDPTGSWYANLKDLSLAELDRLLRKTQAASDGCSYVLRSKLGKAGGIQNVHISPIVVIPKGDFYEGRPLIDFHGKDAVLDRIIPYSSRFKAPEDFTVLRGAYLISKELENRLPTAAPSTRKQIQSLETAANKLHRRCTLISQVLENHGRFVEFALQKNDKAMEKLRQTQLDRVVRQFEDETRGN